ncbi:MAG: Oligopeptide transport ATP-binding protein OppF [Bacillota bacterium]|nr:Oligopeptide transport ATP-binding protein OppF [Bacillota bacterium]
MEILLEAQNLQKCYEKPGFLKGKEEKISAVSNVSLQILKGNSVGLVGESGCGKSTLGRMMAGLEIPTEGQVSYRGEQISGLSLHKMRPYRRNIQMIFQNSTGVFDQSYTIGESIGEVIRNNSRMNWGECSDRVYQILEQVGLNTSYAGRYSKQLSGGERQRANIARALVLQPEFVVCDEPVSSLDYSLRKQILNLLNDIRMQMGTTYLFITHDLYCIPYVCDSLVILYGGKVMEQVDLKKHSMESALHPYTKLLLASVPAKEPIKRKQNLVEGDPDIGCLHGLDRCCPFYLRCRRYTDRCSKEAPVLKEVEEGRRVACHNI